MSHPARSTPLLFSALTLLLCIFITTAGLNPAPARAAGETGEAAPWTLAAEENGIQVFTRPVAGSGIQEFKGIAEVGTAMHSIYDLLKDSNRFKEWFPNTPESKLIKRDENISYQYSVMATPWPTSDRDNVFRSVTEVDRDAGTIRISVSAAPDDYPMQDDRVRVRKANGYWFLEKQSKDRTRVTFVMHLEPGGGIPQWMINARVVATPLEAITNLRKTLGAN
ncbi:MAG: START domain-containing protein [Myxococcota bacterium]